MFFLQHTKGVSPLSPGRAAQCLISGLNYGWLQKSRGHQEHTGLFCPISLTSLLTGNSKDAAVRLFTSSHTDASDLEVSSPENLMFNTVTVILSTPLYVVMNMFTALLKVHRFLAIDYGMHRTGIHREVDRRTHVFLSYVCATPCPLYRG